MNSLKVKKTVAKSLLLECGSVRKALEKNNFCTDV
jgi:hypothetical protein